MPAVRAPIRVQAGSYEPRYWSVTDPDTGDPVDLTAPGFSAAMAVRDDHGAELLGSGDLASSLRLTAEGRVYFEPSSATSTGWPEMRGLYQVELTHPSAEAVRIGQGTFSVDNEIMKD